MTSKQYNHNKEVHTCWLVSVFKVFFLLNCLMVTLDNLPPGIIWTFWLHNYHHFLTYNGHELALSTKWHMSASNNKILEWQLNTAAYSEVPYWLIRSHGTSYISANTEISMLQVALFFTPLMVRVVSSTTVT